MLLFSHIKNLVEPTSTDIKTIHFQGIDLAISYDFEGVDFDCILQEFEKEIQLPSHTKALYIKGNVKI